MEDVLRPVIVFGGAILITFLVGYGVDRLLRRVDRLHPETPLWGLLRRGRRPFEAVVFVGLLNGFLGEAHVSSTYRRPVELLLELILIGASAWLTIRVIAAVLETTFSRYAGVAQDAARVRRVRTQVTLVQRLVTAVVTVIAAASMLMQFQAMKAIGTSVLASAGVLGIVAGIAAQSTLSNLFAGLQIAFGDVVRIGDVVVVEKEFGTVEEITISYLVVRTWDERRLTMPVSYFTSKPFENWSRGGQQMTGTVFLELDHSAPMAPLRECTRQLVEGSDLWDGRSWDLAVTDTSPFSIQVRATMTARNPGDLWNLRCYIREELIGWLLTNYPNALPNVSPEDAASTVKLPAQEAPTALDKMEKKQ